MCKKLTTEEFSIRSGVKHDYFYDYSPSNYIDNKTKVKIICHKLDDYGKEHGVFEQTPSDHLQGKGCPKCGRTSSGNKNRSNNEEFTKKGNLKHNNKYKSGYSLVDYKNNKTKVKLICSVIDEDGVVHGLFLQTPDKHLSGEGCPKCGRITFANKKTKSKDQFIIEGNLKHNNKFKSGYNLVDYKRSSIKIKMICYELDECGKEHGIFEQTPNSHLNGNDCPKCSGTKQLTTEDFNKIGKILHNNVNLDYSLVDYKNNYTKVKIICLKDNHGVFEQTPQHHLNRKQGCPKCNESKGEKTIIKYLIEHNINFIRQKIFNDCRDKLPLKFDLYLPDYNVCIEYDGEGHIKKFHFERNNVGLNGRIKRDKIKTNYCANNNIPLIRITYKDKIIPMLVKKLNELKIIDNEK